MSLKAKVNIWIEKDSEVVLSLWRIRLLEAIEETGSISAAASKMGISYRRAWEKIQECETRLDLKLVDTQTGGSGGGGSSLTPEALDYIGRFKKFTAGLNDLVADRFEAYFSTQETE